MTPVLSDGGELDAGVDDAGNALFTTCNPVTNAGCTGTDVCQPDLGNTNYVCQPAWSTANVPVCGACKGFTSCAPGGLCAGTDANHVYCAQMCCTNADCGSGKCEMTQGNLKLPSGVGVCTPM